MKLETISAEQAERAFAACLGLDPEELATPHTAAHAGRCFRLTGTTGQLIYSTGQRGGALWCFGAAGQGQGMTEAGLNTLEFQARATGCKSVVFQTRRRGLIRKATQRGYEISKAIGAGFLLKKELK